MDVFFLCSVFLILSPVTTTSPTQHVTVVCSRASPIAMTITKALISVGLATSWEQVVILPPKLILRDTIMGSVGLATESQQQQPQSQMLSQAYANYAMGPLQVSFLFQSSASK